jgi:hypothetical protein
MKINVPSKKIRERFFIIYELQGCQKAINFLTEYYGVKRMKIILDGKRVGKGFSGYYLKNRAYFTKRGLTKRIILHELYHHLIDAKGLEKPFRKEEKEANIYAKTFLKSGVRFTQADTC